MRIFILNFNTKEERLMKFGENLYNLRKKSKMIKKIQQKNQMYQDKLNMKKFMKLQVNLKKISIKLNNIINIYFGLLV